MQAKTVFAYLLATLISLSQSFVLSHSLLAAPQPVPQNTPPQNTPPHNLSNEEWQNILAQTNLPNTLPNTLPNIGAEVNVSSVSQQAYLKASNSDAADEFGYSTDLDGDTLVIGTPFEASAARGVNGNQTDNSAPHAGAVYVFVRTGGAAGGSWTQQAYLKASNSEALDGFGGSVAIDGDTLVVATPGEDSAARGVNGNQQDNSASGAGAAYVFVRTASISGSVAGGVWSQQAYLKASNPDRDDGFGSFIAIDGDTVVVGARDEASAADGVNGNQFDNSAEEAGAAYVFVRTASISGSVAAGVWSQQAYLKASNSTAGDEFGDAVAIDGNTVVVGAQDEASAARGVNGNQQDNSAPGAGAAYVFVRTASISGSITGGVWSQQAYLKASNSDAFDHFGESVAIAGETLVVGARGEDSAADGVNGNQQDNSADSAGAAYLFVRTASISGSVAGEVWSQQAYLKASNSEAFDSFGDSVAIAGDTLLVGAEAEASAADGVNGNQFDNSAGDAGAVYLFVRTGGVAGGVWTQQAYLKASNSEFGDRFGNSVAISGNTWVVSASPEDSAADGVNGNQFDNSAENAGAAYVFQRSSQPPHLYFSSTTAGSVANPNGPTNRLVNFADEDILVFNQTSQSWSKYFDGSDVGLSATDVDGLALQGNDILISLQLSATLPFIDGTVGLVKPNDILRFVPTSLGETTRGRFAWFLDASDVGLGSASEDIDGIGFTPDGRLLVSTRGSYNVNTGSLTGSDEDILILNNASFGSTSRGTWARYFDGSDVNLSDLAEDVRGISYSQSSNDLYLATQGLFTVTGLTGDSSDVFTCRPGTLGNTTACTFSLYFDGSANGFGGESIDGLQVNYGAQTVTVTTADAEDTSVDDPNADDQAEEVEESNEEDEINSQLFLPWSAR